MANDSISMRSITRPDTATSNVDVAQLLGKNQTVNGLLGGSADSGFQQMLDTQVNRDSLPRTSATDSKVGVDSDNSRRRSGNDSPPVRNDNRVRQDANMRDSNIRKQAAARDDARREASDRMDDRINSRLDSAAERRQTARSDDDAAAVKGRTRQKEKAAQKQDDSASADQSAEAGRSAETTARSTVAQAASEQQSGKVSEDTDDTAASESFAETASVSNASAASKGATLVAGQGETVGEGVIQRSGETTDLQALLATLNAAAVDGEGEGVDAGHAEALAAADVDTALEANEVIAAQNNAAAVAEPGLKDLITAMLNAKANAGAVTEGVSAQAGNDAVASVGNNATGAVADAEAQQGTTADDALAAVARDLRNADPKAAWMARELADAMQRAAGGRADAGAAASASASTSASETAEAAVSADAGLSVDAGAAAESLGIEQVQFRADEVLPAEQALITSAQTNAEAEAAASALAETEGASADAAVGAEEQALLATDAKAAETEEKTGQASTAVEGAARQAAGVQLRQTVDAKSADTAADNDNWSILDAVADALPKDAKATAEAVKMPPPALQSEQQMTQVRNELRSLERLVESGVPQASRALREGRKEESSADIKPASLARAFEGLSAGVKQADLRTPAVANAPVAVGRPGFAEQMAEKIMLMTTQKVQVADIRMDPKELGSVEVKIRLHQDQASVVFSSPHAQVRDALENSIPRLRELFADAGVGLGSVNVNDRGTSSGGGGEQSQGRGSDSSFAGSEEGGEERSQRAPRKPNGLVDYYA